MKRLAIGGVVLAITLFVSCSTQPSYWTPIIKPDVLELYLVDNKPVARYLLHDISRSHLDIRAIWLFMRANPELGKTLTIEVCSPGGEAFAALRTVGLLDEMRSEGFYIITKCNALAASAGFLIFESGDKRMANKSCLLMWHKATSFFLPDKDLAAIQYAADRRISERCRISVEIIEGNIAYDNWWISGWMALELGLADEIY